MFIGASIGSKKVLKLPSVKRVGSVVTVNNVKGYEALLNKEFLEFTNLLNKHHFRNYSVYKHTDTNGTNFMLRHFEYAGGDYDGDASLVFDSRAGKVLQKQLEQFERPLKWAGALPSEGGSGDEAGDQWPTKLSETHHDGWTPREYMEGQSKW